MVHGIVPYYWRCDDETNTNVRLFRPNRRNCSGFVGAMKRLERDVSIFVSGMMFACILGLVFL